MQYNNNNKQLPYIKCYQILKTSNGKDFKTTQHDRSLDLRPKRFEMQPKLVPRGSYWEFHNLYRFQKLF